VTQIRRNYNGAIAEQFSNYTYRSDGRLERIVNADGTHDFTYNSRGLVATQTITGEGTYSYGYESMGRNDYLEYPDGHVRRQVYDDLGRITSRCYEYSGPVNRCYTAQYDAVGNPTRMTDPQGVDILEYDGLDRLKKVTREEPAGTVIAVEDYDYNKLGALKLNASVALDHQRPKLAGGGNADAAVPATVGGQAITLDAVGRITSLRGATFTWNKKGYLQQAQDPAPAVAEEYAVDAQMRRFAKVQGTAKEYYLYEGLDRVATLNTSGTVVETWLFDGIDHPLRIKQGATTAYYELDLAGNVRALRGPSGTDLGSLRYTAFGQTLVDTTTVSQPLRWKGRWYSSIATGIYDVRARQWAPEIGAFLSIDEYAYHDIRSTLWAWPQQNPVALSDTTGRSGCDPGRCKPDEIAPPTSGGSGGDCRASCRSQADAQLANCGVKCRHDNDGHAKCAFLVTENFKACIAKCPSAPRDAGTD
jgi:RHS repeat-associated protein